MSAENFQRALSLVLKSEGGYVNNPRDPGGATNFGITQAVYDGWRARRNQLRQSVRSIGMADVTAIYRDQYWDAIRGDELPPGIDYAVFDAAVNSGPVQGVKWLQRALPASPVDGHIGLVTLGAVAGINDRAALIERLCAQRLGFLRRLKQWLTFGRGWSNRMASVQAAALAMIG
ncbi:glycoside hydrolase family 108 protein [Labrys monachus]|uniref:Lysozyme family protein n=1 Tax=Labrys monachus TaxID=217067 RepID=A0ABU0FAN9_9HYPH|nr:glycosyl hydrolase 108 family protein [Labrys monachus]MDQ0391128.1 lysozyme family protein [Labrys monachus]